MKKRIAILSLVVVALIGAGYATYDYTRYDRAPGFPALRLKTKTPERVLVKTDGSPGQRFSAIFTVDGDRQEVSGVTPASSLWNAQLSLVRSRSSTAREASVL